MAVSISSIKAWEKLIFYREPNIISWSKTIMSRVSHSLCRSAPRACRARGRGAPPGRGRSRAGWRSRQTPCGRGRGPGPPWPGPWPRAWCSTAQTPGSPSSQAAEKYSEYNNHPILGKSEYYGNSGGGLQNQNNKDCERTTLQENLIQFTCFKSSLCCTLRISMIVNFFLADCDWVSSSRMVWMEAHYVSLVKVRLMRDPLVWMRSVLQSGRWWLRRNTNCIWNIIFIIIRSKIRCIHNGRGL